MKSEILHEDKGIDDEWSRMDDEYWSKLANQEEEMVERKEEEDYEIQHDHK